LGPCVSAAAGGSAVMFTCRTRRGVSVNVLLGTVIEYVNVAVRQRCARVGETWGELRLARVEFTVHSKTNTSTLL